MPPEPAPQQNLGTGLSLEGRVNIYPDAPLPEFAATGGTVYAAQMKGAATADLMAIVCMSSMPPRAELASMMRNIDNPSILRLRESGVVHWTAHNARYFALAYERPLAPRYWRTLDETHPPMGEDALHHFFVMPFVSALAEFERTGIVHGGIRPTNIFWRDGSATPPQLGECLSAPPGISQPVLFETIERAMTLPIGRGPGVHTDDCYAFGITLALAVLGFNPLAGTDDQTIIQMKLQKGSFNTLIGSRRLPTAHIEILRGLLTDDARQRWSATDLEQWLAGRRLTPKNTDAGRRASRHFSLGGKDYWQVRPLAVGLNANIPEAVKLIEGGNLDKWLMRSLGDEERAKDVADSVEQLKNSGKTAHYDDQLVARVCIALDPAAPIRYRGVAVMPSGVAGMLADAIINNGSIQIISEIIAFQFVTLWVNAQKDSKVDLVPLAQQMERVRSMIEKSSYGNGIERALYELNPALACLSPMLRGQYVNAPRALLAALDRVAAQNPARPAEPMDRHIAAFLIARDRRSDSIFIAMGPSEVPSRRALAFLALFSELQHRYGPDEVPHLAKWVLPLLDPVVKRYLSKPMQEKMKRLIKDAADKGSLAAMAHMIDDPRRIQADEQDFLHARLMYQDVTKEIAFIENKLSHRASVAREVGAPVAATVACLVAIAMIGLTLIRAIMQSLG
jgi:hypothetical protein